MRRFLRVTRVTTIEEILVYEDNGEATETEQPESKEAQEADLDNSNELLIGDEDATENATEGTDDVMYRCAICFLYPTELEPCLKCLTPNCSCALHILCFKGLVRVCA